MGIWAALIGGAVVAVIASLLRRGKSGMPWWGTWLAGIGGALIGYWIAGLLGVAETSGIDWIRWAISVGVGVVLIGVGTAIWPKKR